MRDILKVIGRIKRTCKSDDVTVQGNKETRRH